MADLQEYAGSHLCGKEIKFPPLFQILREEVCNLFHYILLSVIVLFCDNFLSLHPCWVYACNYVLLLFLLFLLHLLMLFCYIFNGKSKKK